jgi:hypothetical protein
MPHLEVSELPEYIFLTNTNNNPVHIKLKENTTSKDLFFVCFDLFCKGLVLLYGNENVVNINKISMDQFNLLIDKLKNAGIKVIVYEYDLDTAKLLDKIPTHVSKNILSESVDKIRRMPSNEHLRTYTFYLDIHSTIFEICFEIVS